jgi:hypothetical protein
MVASFMGLNAYPQSTRNKMIVERDRLSKEKFGQSYDDLKIRQQMMVSRTLNKNPEFAIKDPATPQQIERAFRNQVERQQRVQDSLAKPIQQVLAEKGLHVTGYEPTLRIGQTKLFLTEDQTKRYEALIVEEYNRSLKNRARILGRMDPIRGQKLLNDWVLDAKERAQTRLRLEFNR